MPEILVNAVTSASIEQRLNQTLNQWRSWQCAKPLTAKPTLYRALGGGLSNHSFLTAGEQPCVVRIDGINPQQHGLQRAVEWRALEAAHAAGIAPAPVYFNPSLGSMVCAYLPPDTAHEGADLRATARLLQDIHQLPPRRHRLNLGQRIQHYAQQLAVKDPEHRVLGWLADAESLLQTLQDKHAAIVLCHNDLLQSNRLWHEGSLYAIDWEYAAMAHPLYDLAVVIEGDRLEAGAAQRLVTEYLAREPLSEEAAALARYRFIYLYLETLWFCLQPHDDAAPYDIQAQHRRLQRRLAAC